MSIDKEKPYLELSKIKEIASEILDVVFVKNYVIKKEYKPDVDIFKFSQNNKEYFLIVVALPGIKKDSIEISLDQDLLTISAKRELFFPTEMINIEGDILEFINNNSISIENYYGNIFRKIRLPKPVKAKEEKATYFKGMLFIKLEVLQD
ncbi:MAG: Hsp20/alpha crystallin family protein [bacterium]